jgi:hypothetical protein
MADVKLFIDHMRDRIASTSDFTAEGFTQERVYRQYLPQVKSPEFPCITLSFEKEKTEVFADIAVGKLFVSVHSKQFSACQTAANWITPLLHLHKYSDPTLIVYQCHEQGGPPTPSWDEKTESWESMQGFDAIFG